MSGELNRYQHPDVVEHLSSNYVLGTLSESARKRLEALRLNSDFALLNQRIAFWEQKMSPLNEKVPELAPKDDTWKRIQAQLNHVPATQKQPWYKWFDLRFYQWATACSVLLIALFSFISIQQPTHQGALSYVAVLADENQQPQVVAATYGETQMLMLDIIDLPSVSSEETLELWVTSKTDKQARSLGEIPTDVASFSRQLSNAEWRLIKDSDSLLITVEEAGGSPIGEPMGNLVSQGVCIRLSGWQEQV